ncbi:MAG: HlyD family efflux transporter periplasmic adaptor subunit [bacterium]
MRPSRAQLIGVAAIAVVGVGVVLARRPHPLDVETALVRRGPLETTVDADGRTRVRERYVVTAPVAGRLERIALVEGSAVHAGDVVATIAPMPIDMQSAEQARSRIDGAVARVGEAATRVRITRASADLREKELERARRLIAAGALAPRDTELVWFAWRQANEDAHAATAQAQSASADVRLARSALIAVGGHRRANADDVVLVRSPVAGTVLRIPERSERVTAAGAALLELGDSRSIEVVADVLSSDAATLCKGNAVRLEQWGGDSVLTGRVRSVEPAAFTRVSALGVDEQRVNVIIDIPLAPATLGDGYRVEARIVTWSRPDVVTVPVSALVRQGNSWTTYVMADGRARRREVRIGHVGDANAEVLGGLTASERVVLFPSDKVVDGVRIAVHD